MHRVRTVPAWATLGAAAVLALGLLGCLNLRSLTGSGSPNVAPSDAMEATVVKVVDGDTIHVLVDGRREKVRLIGVDTPESTSELEPFGAEASAYTKAALLGRRVWLETDVELRDRYERLLAYVWLEEPRPGDDVAARAMFNARIVGDGYAQIYTFPPNVRYTELLLRLQREARNAGRGLWATPTAADPLTGPRAESAP